MPALTPFPFLSIESYDYTEGKTSWLLYPDIGVQTKHLIALMVWRVSTKRPEGWEETAESRGYPFEVQVKLHTSHSRHTWPELITVSEAWSKWRHCYFFPSGMQIHRRLNSRRNLFIPGGLFLQSPETFRDYFGCHNSLISFQRREVLSHQTSQASWFFLHRKHAKDQLYKQADYRFTTGFSGTKNSPDFRENGPQGGEGTG